MSIVNLSGLSRRDFLTSSSVLVLGTCTLKSSAKSLPIGEPFNPNLFVQISADSTVTITAHRSEMGQGIRTAIAQIVADELDADWNQIRVNQAPGESIYGDQNTDGSKSIRTFYEPLRQAGASAREMLIQAAATKWGIDPTQCYAEQSRIKRRDGGRALSYGDLVELASVQAIPNEPKLKSLDEFKYIGKALVHVDALNIATGKAKYGADKQMADMVVAVLVRAPSLGSKVVKLTVPDSVKNDSRFIATEILNPPEGAILFNPVGGVAIVATDTYTAMKLANSVEIEWEESTNKSFDSTVFQNQLREATTSPGNQLFEIGDPDSVLSESSNVVEATYETAFLSHAPMEPPVAIANVTSDSVEVWAPVQDPQTTKSLIVGALGVDPASVTVTPTLLGGAFGRKSKPDFVLEATELSRRLKRPVRVQWSREDDIHYDYFHAASAQMYKAALGENDLPEAWLQRTAFPSITTTFSPLAQDPAEWELDMGFTNTPYRCENQRFEANGIRAGVRIGWLRSVCNIFHAFAANVFVDELAEKAGVDPIDYRLAMWPVDGILKVPGMQPAPGHGYDMARLRHVLNRVRVISDWDAKRQAGKGVGVAIHHSFYSYVATVIEVSKIADRYEIDNAYVVLDCGTYINSDTCVAQMEGAVIFGLSLATRSQISIREGRVQESNFDGYQVLRMNDAPNIAVELVASNELPAGVGEPGVPPVAPAYVNAIRASGGERLRKLPAT